MHTQSTKATKPHEFEIYYLLYMQIIQHTKKNCKRMKMMRKIFLRRRENKDELDKRIV